MPSTSDLIQQLNSAIRHGTPLPESFLRALRDELIRLSAPATGRRPEAEQRAGANP